MGDLVCFKTRKNEIEAESLFIDLLEKEASSKEVKEIPSHFQSRISKLMRQAEIQRSEHELLEN